MANGEKRIASTVNDLVFFTNTDESDYPIYITDSREVWLKARPRAPIVATFFVKNFVKNVVDDISQSHELYSAAVQAISEVTKSEPEEVSRLEITYEVYRGDVEEALGEAKAYVILILSRATPFRRDRRRAWAIGFDWKKRAAAKYPAIADFIYLKDLGKHHYDVRLCVKLPTATAELERLFSMAVSPVSPTVGDTGELEAQVDALKREIEQKRAELKALEERLDALLIKLQLERMKRGLV